MNLEPGAKELSILEAIANLSILTEMNAEVSLDEMEQEEEMQGRIALWKNEPLLKETFRVVHKYLQNMIRNNLDALQDQSIQKGVQAIMLLASEAAQKMDQMATRSPKHYFKISGLKEYLDLQKYYKQHIFSKVPQQEVLEGNEHNLMVEMETEKRNLQNVEAVRKDQNYELFFIKNENDQYYFQASLLRHIRLIGNFDELLNTLEGDPLLSVREHFDREVFTGAKEVLAVTISHIDEFYKEAMKHKNNPYVASINKALMALRMAVNPKHLIENQSYKSCLEYYNDFHKFLRDALCSSSYKKQLHEEENINNFSRELIHLTHALCYFFFTRIEPCHEALKLIHQMIAKGKELQKGQKKEKELCPNIDKMFNYDESLRFLLKHYPNGPVLRVLDTLREKEIEGYDPLSSYNFPSQIFAFSQNNLHVSVMRIPCPVKQTHIHTVHIAEEFIGFLRFCRQKTTPNRILMVNLQNRTAWEEFARCKALEDLSRAAEHAHTFYLLTIAKDTEFYYQKDEYQSVGGADVFMEEFKAQIINKEECGYVFPESLKFEKIVGFIEASFKVIHRFFFDEQGHFSRYDKFNFIEIFYLLLILKAIELLKVDFVSFTCKDALDTGMAQTALLYGFLKIMTGESWNEKERDQLLWMLYSPALFVRERAIHEPRLKRALLALDTIEKQHKKHSAQLLKAVNSLYDTVHFPLKITYFHSLFDS